MKYLLLAVLSTMCFIPFAGAQVQNPRHVKVKTLLIENLPDQAACAAVQTSMDETISQLEQKQIIPKGLIVATAKWKTFCHKRCESACVAKVTEAPGLKVSLKHGKQMAGANRMAACEQEQLDLPGQSLVLWSGVIDAFDFFRYRCQLFAIVVSPE